MFVFDKRSLANRTSNGIYIILIRESIFCYKMILLALLSRLWFFLYVINYDNVERFKKSDKNCWYYIARFWSIDRNRYYGNI